VVGQYFSLVYLGPLNSSDFFYWTFIFDNPKVKFVRKDNSDAISEPGPVFGPGPILGPNQSYIEFAYDKPQPRPYKFILVRQPDSSDGYQVWSCEEFF
jgi:hypothetical protein